MARKLASLGIIFSMLGMPLNAYAEPVIKPRIVVSIHSKYVHYIDHSTLYQYLSKVALFYPIYQGVYYIYIRDRLPVNIKFPPRAAGGHIAGAVAFIDAKAFNKLNLDIYYGITHELAEMAVNPNLDQFYPDGIPMEICDGINAYFNLNGHKMAYFKMPNQ